MTPESERPGWLRRLGLQRPELRAWALYDVANSAFFTTIVASVFPVYFKTVAADGASWGAGRFALVTTLALLCAALLGPVVGALADLTAAKKRLLALCTAVGCLSTAGLALVGRGDWVLAATLFGIGNVAVSVSLVLYDALLPGVAREGELDRVSTTGFAAGYLGGGVLLACQFAWITNPERFGLEPGTAPARLAFLSVAVWWALFAIPLLLRVPEPPARPAPPSGEGPARGAVAARAWTGTFRQVGATLRELRVYRQAFLMLVAMLVYNDGIGTVIRMATLYGSEVGVGDSDLFAAILIVQFVGVPCAALFGPLADRIGTKRGILFGLAVYLALCVFAYRMRTATEFYALAITVGAVQGGTQALSRSLFASLVPVQQSGSFFGVFSVLEKFAGVLGPLCFALAIAATGSSRGGILSLVLFFALGALLLSRVDVAAGRRLARETEERLAQGWSA